MKLLLSPSAALRLAEIRFERGRCSSAPKGRTHGQEQGAPGGGVPRLRLGPRVLRTETAALTALALLQREFGDL
jgi:16S rRNA (uracil1498-N3)-methyltransferase